MNQKARNSKPLKIGKKVEITRNINCIPKGVYHFAGKEGPMLFFQIGNEALFGVTDDAEDALKVVKGIPATSIGEFLDSYYRLLPLEQARPFRANEPFTFCAISPGTSRDWH